MEIKYKNLSRRILSSRLIFLVLTVVFVVGGFVGPSVVFAGQTATSIDQVSLSLQIAKNPELSANGDSGYYNALFKISSPQSLSVGSALTLGPRSGSVIIKGFGLGLVTREKLDSSCVSYGSYADCNFVYSVPVQRNALTSDNPASGVIVFDKNVRSLLGILQGQDSEVAVYPYIELTDGKKISLLDSGFSLAHAGQVLADYTGTQIGFTTSFHSNFVRLASGSDLQLKAAFKLTSPDEIQFDLGTDEIEGYDVEELRFILVGEQEFGARCANVPNDECSAQYESPADFYEERILKKGSTASFDVTIPWNSLRSLNLKTSDAGTLNKVYVIPRITFTTPGVDPLDIAGAKNIFYIQGFNTKQQVQDNQGKPPPSEVPANTEASGEGQNSSSTFDKAILGFVNTILALVASAITELINLLFFYFVGPFIEALLSIRTYTDQFAGIIYPAWEIFRNLGNIIFILAIIATGLATVFRVGGWQAKDILVKLIMGAILINFSLVIAQTVLGVADTVQNQFLPADTGAIRLLGQKLMVEGTRQAWENLWSGSPGSFGSFGEAVRILASLLTGIIAFVAFVAISLFLGIRIIFLWLLLMTSPLPYVAMVLPVTRGITKRWWSNFIKYAFMTPAMAFMLNLSALIASRQKNIVQELSEGRYGKLSGNVETVMFTLGANAIVIIFLFLSLKVASAMGAESGGLVEKITNKGVRASLWGAKAPLSALGWGASALNRSKQEATKEWSQGGVLKRAMFAALNPVTTGKAIMDRRKAKKDELSQRMAASAYDAAGGLLPSSIVGPRTRRFITQNGAIYSKIDKDEPWVSEENALSQLKDVVTSGKTDEQTRNRFATLMIQLAKDADVNDVLEEAGRLGFNRNYTADRHGYAGFIQEALEKGLLSDIQNADLQARLSDIYKANGTPELMGQVKDVKGRQLSVRGKLANGANGQEIFVPEGGKLAANGLDVEALDPNNKTTDFAHWEKNQTAIDKHLNKIGASKRMAQHNSNWVFKDKSGFRLSESALEMALIANDRDFAAAESMDTRARQYMIDSLRNEDTYKKELGRLQEKLIKKKEAAGFKVDRTAGSTDMKLIVDEASQKMKEFSEKVLLYDVKSDTKLDREQKHEGAELMKDSQFLENVSGSISRPQDKNGLVNYYDQVFFARGSYKYQLDNNMSSKIGDINDGGGVLIKTADVVRKEIQDKALFHMAGLFAGKIEPVKYNLIIKDSSGNNIPLSLGQMDNYRQTIEKVMKDVMVANPNMSMRDLTSPLQTELATELAKLSKSDGKTKINPSEAKLMSERIFGGFERA